MIAAKISRLFKKRSDEFRSKGIPVVRYTVLFDVLAQAIVEGALPAGEMLPPTRKLAEVLHVSRSTVVKAYDMLAIEGYADVRQGAGYTIRSEIYSDQTNFIKTESQEELEQRQSAVLAASAKAFLQTSSRMNSTDQKSLAFRPGIPPLDLFPVGAWRQITNTYWRNIRLTELTYSPSSGMQQLKENLAKYLNISRSIRCSPDQIFITSGSLQSIFLVGSALVDPGDRVVLEEPTFPNVISIFHGLRAELMPLSVDSEGARVAEWDRSAKLVHITPSCHYPFSNRMSQQRMEELLDRAHGSGSILIENDYEHEVNHWNHARPVLYNLDSHGQTVYMSTFNRLLHPSIRLGFMVVPPFLRAPIEAMLKHTHRFVPPSLQWALNRFLEKAILHRHVENLVPITRDRMTVFRDAWGQQLQDYLPLLPGDVHGLHVTAMAKNRGKTFRTSDVDWVQALEREEIIAHPLSRCYWSRQPENGLIMGYSSVHSKVIPRKVERMERVLLSKLV